MISVGLYIFWLIWCPFGWVLTVWGPIKFDQMGLNSLMGVWNDSYHCWFQPEIKMSLKRLLKFIYRAEFWFLLMKICYHDLFYVSSLLFNGSSSVGCSFLTHFWSTMQGAKSTPFFCPAYISIEKFKAFARWGHLSSHPNWGSNDSLRSGPKVAPPVTQNLRT